MKTHNRRRFLQNAAASGLGLAMLNGTDLKANSTSNVPIGMIGMDTSHSVAFSKYINERNNGFEVTTAYTTVSKDIPSSYERVEQFTDQISQSGIQIVNTIDELLEKTECILLETNDGRLHLEQSKAVFESGKRVFIDKPVAATFQDVKEIYQLSEKSGVPMFSSSGTRYMSKAQEARAGSVGEVLGADTYSPVSYDPNHSELFWYGIHGVELLFTAMRTGCKRVRRNKTERFDIVTGEWENGSIGTFRGILAGEHGYGGQVFGTEGLAYLGGWEGYDPLVEAILQFFKTGKAPIDPAETLEIYAFMEAAVLSAKQNGDWIDIDSIR